MQDQRDSRGDRGGAGDGHEGRNQSDRGHRDGPRGGGGGPDTRFLQLEMSQVLYAEAEDVARPAFRELLLEAAKDRLRERFGAKITELAERAVDELLRGLQASLDVEARIRQHQDEPARDAFAARAGSGEPAPRRAAAKRARGRERGGRGAR